MAGSYLLIRGFSLLAGGYPNEFMIYDSLVNEKFLSQNNMLFVYLIGMVVMAIFSIQKQLKLRQENISLFDYKRFDVKYRQPSPGTGLAKPKYQPIPGGQNDDDLA